MATPPTPISSGTLPEPRSNSIGQGTDNTDNRPIKHHKLRRYHLFDLHNFKFKFRIIKRNNNFNKGEIKRMRGWTYRHLKENGYNIEVLPNYIFIFNKERTLTNKPKETEKKLIEKLQAYALRFAKENGFEIDPNPMPISKEVKIKDFRVMENFRTKNFKSVYPVPSELEHTNRVRAVKDSIKFISHVDQIENLLSEFANQLELHLEVQTENLKTQKMIQANLKPKPNIFRRLIVWLRKLRK